MGRPLRFRRVRLEEQYRKEAEVMAELQADREDCNCGKDISLRQTDDWLHTDIF